jgi:hypothetical protein
MDSLSKLSVWMLKIPRDTRKFHDLPGMQYIYISNLKSVVSLGLERISHHLPAKPQGVVAKSHLEK